MSNGLKVKKRSGGRESLDLEKMHKMVEGDIDIRQFKETDLQGWWNKLQLFHPETYLPGVTLYMDLDVVITGNIDCFFTHEAQLDFCGMNDFNPVTKIWNSSIMRFKQQDLHGRIWHKFMTDRPNWLRRFPGDQNLISEIKVDAFDKNNEAMKIFEESNCLQSALMNQPCNKDIYRHQVALLKERAGRLSLGFFNKNIHLNIQSSQEMFTDIQDKYADAIWHTSSSLHPNQFSLERQILESASDKDIRIQILHHDLNIFHESLTLQRLKLTVTDSKSKSILEDVSLLEKFNKNEVIIDFRQKNQQSKSSDNFMNLVSTNFCQKMFLVLSC